MKDDQAYYKTVVLLNLQGIENHLLSLSRAMRKLNPDSALFKKLQGSRLGNSARYFGRLYLEIRQIDVKEMVETDPNQKTQNLG